MSGYKYHVVITNICTSVTSNDVTLTVNPAPSTIVVTGPTAYTYDGNPQGPHQATVTGSGGNVTYLYIGTGSTIYGSSSTEPINAGTYSVTGTVAADANHNGASSDPYPFVINGAPLTITASDQSKCFGQTLDLGTTLFTTSALISTQTVTNVTLASTGGYDASGGVAGVHSNDITPSNPTGSNGFVAANYVITYVSGTLTVYALPVVSLALQTNVSCNGGNDGAISVNVTGGATYSWTTSDGVIPSGQESVQNPSGLIPGTYKLIVTSANGCTSNELDVTITQPNVLSATVNSTNVTCNGANDGTISITAPTGGYGTYEYSIDGSVSWEPTGIYTGLTNTNYVVEIRDKAHPACVVILNAALAITQPAAISGSGAVTSDYSGSQLTCATSTNGIITVTATGGTGTLMYSIDGGLYQASNVFTGLAAGTHTLSVQDANLCTFVPSSVTITAPLPISSNAVVTSNHNGSQLSCPAATDGQITVTASGGTPGLIYSKDNGVTYQLYDANNVFNSLGAGTYQIVVKDANGCTSTEQDVTIIAPSVISSNAVVTSDYNGSQLSCATSSDGTITVTASGGTGVLQYSDDNGVTYQLSNLFNNLGAGTYKMVVKDANGCTSVEQDVTITAPSAISSNAVVTSNYNGSQISCATSSDGTITVTASGGTGTLQYSDDNGVAYQLSNVFSNLGAGTYKIVVKDANYLYGCPNTEQDVTITAPVAISSNAAVTSNYNGSQLSCATSTDGVITVTASNGTGTLTYSDDNGVSYQAGNVFSNLGAGTYKMVVKDANGCTSVEQDVTITAPVAISSNAAVTSDYNGSQLSCATSSDGTITVTASGGTGVLQYSDDNGVTYQLSNLFNNLGAGTYKMVVKDANGCTSVEQDVTITAPSAISSNAVVTSNYNGSQISCATSSDGTITVTASGGTGTLQYSDDNGVAYQLSNVFSNLGAGTYKIVVKDANYLYGCPNTEQDVTITAPLPISSNAVVTSNHNGSQLSCPAATDGQITVTASGGTPGIDILKR